MLQMLLGEGDWAKVPASSQMFMDIRHRLIFMYQYHADYYFADTEVDQEYLKVESTKSCTIVTINTFR